MGLLTLNLAFLHFVQAGGDTETGAVRWGQDRSV